MIGSDIILRYRLQVDDASELSDAEEIALLNEIYTDVTDDREWEWLKAPATGNTSISVPYIALPADFKNVVPNKDGKSVIFIGTDYNEYQVIPFSSRRDHRDQDGYCYIDVPNQRLVFTLQPTSVKAVEYDYIKRPAAITVSTAPLITTTKFGDMIAYGMAAKFTPIENGNKMTSYANENQLRFKSILLDYATEDAMIKLSI